ncbi:MAG: hypothetical protein VX431_01970 [Planctomycetota bacterium]|nr:hypothetical protein [Planctomycetota bacterium]
MKNISIPLILLTLVFLGWGCRREDPIVRYRVAKDKSSNASVAGEMFVALTVRNGEVYFFKAVGTAESMEPHRSAIRSFLAGLTFPADGPPKWTLPEGWSQRSAASGMRLATLVTQSPPIEVVVSSLRQTNPNWQAYMASNLNRWRGQMGLAPLAAPAAAEAFETLQADGQKIFFTSILGQRPGPPPSLATRPDRPAAGFDPSFVQGTPPAGWKPGPVRGMRKAAFRFSRGDESIEVTVISAGGDQLDNVNRWRGQVGLGKITTEQMQSETQEISAGALRGQYFAIFGAKQAILAAMFPTDGGGNWFVKLSGNRSLAEQQAETFKTFIRSLTFKTARKGKK